MREARTAEVLLRSSVREVDFSGVTECSSSAEPLRCSAASSVSLLPTLKEKCVFIGGTKVGF